MSPATAAADSVYVNNGRASAKTEHGQFFTTKSPFTHPEFRKWLDGLPPNPRMLEPYAGANNLVRMVNELRPGLDWTCFDIQPAHPDVVRRDTIASFPHGYDAVVTNPPYLAKNSATRRKLHHVVNKMAPYDNLYKRCVADCLAHTPNVAAIIPEQYLSWGQFFDRLTAVVLLNTEMFSDTDQPTLLALWIPSSTPDFSVWAGDAFLGSYKELISLRPQLPSNPPAISFNRVDGQVGLLAVDTPSSASVEFVRPEKISPDEIKHSSRHRTRIHVDGLQEAELPDVLARANQILGEWRKGSADIGMTAFMGLRRDGMFRRRLDFATARAIVAQAVQDVRLESGGSQ